MDMSKTAAFIAQKRKEKNLTQRQLAEILSVSDKTISKWETAKGMPDVSVIADLCNALGITPTEFFYGENSGGNQNVILEVAQDYRKIGKKRMICYFTFITAMSFTVAGSFFGDGVPKIVTTITAYIVSAIAAYKLGAISISEIKKLQKTALALFALTVIMAVDLGYNYFTALNIADGERIKVYSQLAWLLFGDYGWSLQRFLIGFKNSVGAAILAAGQNIFLLASRLRNS